LRNRLRFSFWILIFGRRHHQLVSAATLYDDSIPDLTFLGSYQSAHSTETETLHLHSAICKLQVAGPWLFTYLIHDDVALSSSLQLAVSSPAANKRQRSLGERAQTVFPPSAFCRSLPAGTHSFASCLLGAIQNVCGILASHLTVALIRSFRGDTPWRSEAEAPPRELKGTCNLYWCHGTTPSILYIGASYRHPVARAGSHRCPCQRALITSPALASEYFQRSRNEEREKESTVQERRGDLLNSFRACSSSAWTAVSPPPTHTLT